MNVIDTKVNGEQTIDVMKSKKVSSSNEEADAQIKATLESDVVNLSITGLKKLEFDNVNIQPNGSGGGDGIEPPKVLGSGGGDGIEPPK